MKVSFFIFRNCFTGGVSGGDVHNADFNLWVQANKPEASVSIIHPKVDGQSGVYSDIKDVRGITYSGPVNVRSFSISFIVRAIWTLLFVRVSLIEGKKNVVISSSHFLPDVLPALKYSFFKQKVTRVVLIHHIVQHMNRPTNINNLLALFQEKICFAIIKKYYDKIIVVNTGVKAKLIEMGFEQQILVSANSVGQEYFEDSVKAIADRDIDVVFLGRLMPQKGIDDFIKIIQQLVLEMPQLKVVMLGTGPEYDRLKSEIVSLGLPVKMPGFVSNSRKTKILKESKLLVFPSYEEGWGMAIAEALASGANVIAYQLPVYKEVFESNLDTVAIGDVESMSLKAIKILRGINAPNEDSSKQMSYQRNYIKKYSLNSVCSSEYDFMVGEK